MKTKTKKSSKLIVLSVLFGLCMCLSVLFGGVGTTTAYAATTPKYTLTVSGTQANGQWGGGHSSELTDVTSVTVRKSLSASDTVSFYLNGSSTSGTSTLASNSYISFSDVYLSASVSDCTITLCNEVEEVLKTGTGSLSANLSDGRYKVKFNISRSGGAGYTQWSGAISVYTFFIVDSTAPSISGATTSTTNYKNTSFSVSASDSGSGLSNFYVKSPTASSYTAVSSPKIINATDTNGLYCFYAKDKAGNQTSTYYVYLDTTKPTGVIKNSSGTTITSSYTKSAFSYTASDGHSGISYLQYKTPSSSSWTTYTSGTQIAATATNGTYQFRAVDKAGNISETKSIYLDSVNPVGVLYSGTSAVSSGTKSTASYIKYVASDASSGIQTVYVKLPNASSYSTYSNGTQLTTNGTYSFYGVDNAGNQSTTMTISLDNTKPTLSISKGSFGGTLNDSFTVNASDNIGGVSLYYKKPNGSFVQSTSASVTISKTEENGTYQFYAVDGFGNQSATYSVALSIDAPIAQIVKASDSNQVCIIWTDNNATGKLNGESYVNGTWIKAEGNHTFVLTNDANRSSTYMFTIDHFYEENTIVAPTCIEQGYTIYKCKNCGDTYNANYVEALGHNYIVVKEIESSCTADGYSVYVCTRCGDTYNDDVVLANGHSFGSWYVVKDATCTDNGSRRRDCVSCGVYEMESVAPKGHDYVSSVTISTCTEEGYTTHVCSRCNATYVDNYVKAKGHKYVAKVTEPNCTDRGYTTQSCSVCGDSYIENYVNAHGHEYGAWRITVEPTCTENGLRYKTCSTCNYKYNEAINSLGHDYNAEIIEPTCVDKGYTTHICSRCGTGYNDTFTNALGHDYKAKRVEPTCMEEGYIGQCCSRCSDMYKTEILKAVGHDYVETYIEVTCTEEGCVLHTCLACQYEYRTNIVNPSGHSLTTHVRLASTCTEEGERYYSCSKCNYEKEDVIPAKGHKYELVDEKNNDGMITRRYACGQCGEYFDEDVGEQYVKVSNYVEYLFNEYSPYMMWVFLATAGVWSIAMGIAIIIATKNEDKAKAKKMLVNYGIGLIVIFAILVAAPYLVKGIAALVT